jgi:hypothetical protein
MLRLVRTSAIRAAPSLCGGSLDSRAIFLKTKLLFLKPYRGTVDILYKRLSPGDESACHPNPESLRQVERNPFNAGATIWRSTAQAGLRHKIRHKIRSQSAASQAVTRVVRPLASTPPGPFARANLQRSVSLLSLQSRSRSCNNSCKICEETRPSAKCLARIEIWVYKCLVQNFTDFVMFARRSTFAVLLLSCLACWLSCVIVLEEIPELLSLTDNTSNDFTVRKAASTECVHVLRVEKQGAIKILARAAEQVAAELWKSTFQGTIPTCSALFIVNSVLRR